MRHMKYVIMTHDLCDSANFPILMKGKITTPIQTDFQHSSPDNIIFMLIIWPMQLSQKNQEAILTFYIDQRKWS